MLQVKMKKIAFKRVIKLMLVFTLLILAGVAIWKVLPTIKELPVFRREPSTPVVQQITPPVEKISIERQIAELEARINRRPGNYKLHFELAKLYEKKGLPTLALIQYRRVIDLAPRRASEAQLAREWINVKSSQAISSLYENIGRKYAKVERMEGYISLTGELANIIREVETKERKAATFEMPGLTPVVTEKPPTPTPLTPAPTHPGAFLLIPMPYTPSPQPR